jgi:hypothetical protein
MGNLFEDKNLYTEKNPTQADQVFTESFKGMTSEINRVANEKVTVWGLLVSWIYDVTAKSKF